MNAYYKVNCYLIQLSLQQSGTSTSAHSTMQEQYWRLLKYYMRVIKYTQCSVAYGVHGMQVYATLHTERFKLLILTKHDPDI